MPSAWRDVLDTARPWRPDGCRSPLVRSALVVVPHPDDEAVMFGGLVAHLASHDAAVRIVAVTDGDAAYPDAVDGDALARIREREQRRALAELGLTDPDVTRLRIPDGFVGDHEVLLADVVSAMLGSDEIDLVVAPWAHDHHTDHEACGRAVEGALARSRGGALAAYGLFWSLLRTQPPAALALAALELTTAEQRRKDRAIRCHTSQVAPVADLAVDPVLGAAELAPTTWTCEHYLLDGLTSGRR